MRLLIQECLRGSVAIDGKVVSSIGRGEVVLVSFTKGDDERTIGRMIHKLLNLRIFPDEAGKTNLSIQSIHGSILAVSQFTLYADLTAGNRPSFVHALGGEEANVLYETFKKMLSQAYPDTCYGVFGADMKVELINDGPFTIWLDSKELFE